MREKKVFTVRKVSKTYKYSEAMIHALDLLKEYSAIVFLSSLVF